MSSNAILNVAFEVILILSALQIKKGFISLFFIYFHFSIENGCQRHDCLPIANQGAEMAMVANFLQTSVQKFKARLHHFHASAADVSFFLQNRLNHFIRSH